MERIYVKILKKLRILSQVSIKANYYLWYSSLPLKIKRSILKDFLLLTAPVYFVRELIYGRRYEKVASDSLWSVDSNIGFGQIELNSNLIDEAIRQAKNALLSNYKVSDGKKYLRIIGSLNNGEITKDSPIYRLFVNDEIVSFVRNYLNEIPILQDISVLYSPKSNQQAGIKEYSGSQLFHRDGDDLKSMKIWVLCDTVTLESGPTVLIPYKCSEIVADEIKYRTGRKVESDLPFQEHLSSAIHLVGNIGKVFATDTVSCFHYGSRTSSDKDRLVIMAHFVTKYSDYTRPFLSLKVSTRRKPRNFINMSKLEKIIFRA